MKKSRIRKPSSAKSQFGLLAWLEETRVALPLKGVECRFEVTGAIACVELDQIYHQNTARPLDCTYTFPLPAGAAVHRCELHVNGRVIRAKVEEQADALRIYREQKAAGRRAALVETERENLFTLSLGNVQPGDVIVVRFAWFQVLDRAGAGLRLFVPTCPGVRYIPGQPLLRSLSGRGTVDDTDQVPDASRITPPRIDALHPDAAYFSLEGRLSAADVESGTASSPSHPICVRESAGQVTVELSRRGTVPDRDFVLAWREPQARQVVPQSWRWTEGAETYALVQLRAPAGVPVAETFPQDFYFLIDRSGSMEGAKWQQTCRALPAFVSLLGAEDRVWITLFESYYRDFAEVPVSASAVLADQGFQRLEALGTTGGTELLPAARHLLGKIAEHSADRHTVVVLITDGQVGNDHAILQAFKNVPRIRVHTFGIDTAVNDAFLQALARQQRGGCWLQTPDDDIAGTIAALGDRLRRPVLADLSVRGSWEPGQEAWPDLHAEEVVAVSLRGEAMTPLEITGRLPDGSRHIFHLDLVTGGSEAVKLLWAKERIAALLAANRPAEAIGLARKHNLICRGAAFIAWDEAEQVQVAQETIIQPAQSPDYSHTVMLSSCFGPSPAQDLSRASISEEYVRRLGCYGQSIDNRANPPIDAEENARQHLESLARWLRETFAQLGVPEVTVEALVVWAQKEADKAERRLTLLNATGQFIELLRRKFEDLFEPRIQKALHGSPEALPRWADKIRKPVNRMIRLRQMLGTTAAPPQVARRLVGWTVPDEVLSQLFAWVLEKGTFDARRLAKLETLAQSLSLVPYSGGSKPPLWRAFLAANFDAGAPAHAAITRWLQAAEAPRQNPTDHASV